MRAAGEPTVPTTLEQELLTAAEEAGRASREKDEAMEALRVQVAHSLTQEAGRASKGKDEALQGALAALPSEAQVEMKAAAEETRAALALAAAEEGREKDETIAALRVQVHVASSSLL